jgi:DUF4097 and DUF4098 domain-containing protein YvlB
MHHQKLSHGVRPCLVLAISSLPLLALTGCAAVMANLARATATEQREFSVSAQPSVVIDTFNGSVTVKVNPENKVEAIVTKVGSGANHEAALADLKNVGVDYTQDGETVRITARRVGPKSFGSSGASLDLKVPARTVLSLTTRNGEISTEGIQGDLVAQSSNGGLNVHGGKGKLELRTTNGTIKVDAAPATVIAETSNGDVRFVGSLARGSHSLATSNGSVDLKLPAETQFQFDSRTSNGSVSNRFPGLQPTSGKTGSTRLAGLVGSGPAPEIIVKLETSNGSITIEPTQPAEAPRP